MLVPAADLVQDHEAARRRLGEDLGGLAHLHHEGALALGEAIRGADAGEDAVHDADARGARGHEAPDLGEQHDQRDLAQVGALAGHVRAGEQQEPRPGVVELGVVRHERLALGLKDALHHRVAPAADLEARLGVDLGPHPAIAARDLGQRLQRVELGGRVCGRADARPLAQRALAQLLEDLALERRRALARSDHAALHLAQLARREALRVGERLLALVVRGHALEVRSGHLERVAEHGMEAHAQARDPAALALARLERGDPGAALLGGLAQRVELGPEARADEARLAGPARAARERARVVHQGVAQELLELAQRLREPQAQRSRLREERLPVSAECARDPRQRLERGAQLTEIARLGAGPRALREQTLEIAHRRPARRAGGRARGRARPARRRRPGARESPRDRAAGRRANGRAAGRRGRRSSRRCARSGSCAASGPRRSRRARGAGASARRGSSRRRAGSGAGAAPRGARRADGRRDRRAPPRRRDRGRRRLARWAAARRASASPWERSREAPPRGRRGRRPEAGTRAGRCARARRAARAGELRSRVVRSSRGSAPCSRRARRGPPRSLAPPRRRARAPARPAARSGRRPGPA